MLFGGTSLWQSQQVIHCPLMLSRRHVCQGRGDTVVFSSFNKVCYFGLAFFSEFGQVPCFGTAAQVRQMSRVSGLHSAPQFWFRIQLYTTGPASYHPPHASRFQHVPAVLSPTAFAPWGSLPAPSRRVFGDDGKVLYLCSSI